MPSKKILIPILIAAFIGGIFGSLISSRPAEANLFKDFYNQHIKPLFLQEAEKQEINQTPEKTPGQLPVYSPTIDYEQAIINTVEQVSSAVISIIVSKDLPIIEKRPHNPFFGLPQEFQQFFGQQFEFYQPYQRGTERREIGGGSGFIISSDGLIVTNKHVVSDEEASYTVLTNDGKKYDAKVLARDPHRDFAVLKILASGLPVVRLGDSDSVKLGQTAIAIGNALGEFRNTVSVGAISGLSRDVTAAGRGLTERFEGLIQTDAAINQGNSGGPLLNLKGEVIGINVAMVFGAQNIGFAIPINQVKEAIESVKKTGRIITAYLGIRYVMTDEGALIRGNQDRPGIFPNSPAAKAGLREGDIIAEMNGEKLNQDNHLGKIIRKYKVGDKIKLKVLRNNEEIILEAILEERPKEL